MDSEHEVGDVEMISQTWDISRVAVEVANYVGAPKTDLKLRHHQRLRAYGMVQGLRVSGKVSTGTANRSTIWVEGMY